MRISINLVGFSWDNFYWLLDIWVQTGGDMGQGGVEYV